jgi:hypothetical protein
MSKKPKKTKNKQTNPTDAGFDAEQVLADTLCDQFQRDGVDEDDIDEAFVAAFKSLSYRMFKIYNKEFVVELVAEMAQIVDEEDGKPHVCKDCMEKHGPVLVSEEDKGKLH